MTNSVKIAIATKNAELPATNRREFFAGEECGDVKRSTP